MDKEEFLGKLQMCYFGERNAFDEIVSEFDRLKAREEEISKMYLAGHKYASEIEGKYITEKYIVDELEKWLENEIRETEKGIERLENTNSCRISNLRIRNANYRETLTKLKKLKEEIYDYNN